MKRIRLGSGGNTFVVNVYDETIKRLSNLTDFWIAVDYGGEAWYYNTQPIMDLDVLSWGPAPDHLSYLEDISLPRGVYWDDTLTFVPCIEDIIVE